MVVVVLGRRDALSVRKFEEVNLPNAFYGNKMKWRGGIEEEVARVQRRWTDATLRK